MNDIKHAVRSRRLIFDGAMGTQLQARGLPLGELPERWKGILSRYSVRPEDICLEITESAMVSSRLNLGKVTDALREMGFTFALDDYGTGYANSAFIMEFPFEIIKIDKSILWGAIDNEKADRILQHTISMVHDLDMKVVVEGVETAEQRDKLLSAGVEYLQGYYYSKPVPGGEALAKAKAFGINNGGQNGVIQKLQ